MTPQLIEFQNVTVWRGDRPALHSLNLSIPIGEHVAILGPNGSGKSTLIKTITRECYPYLTDPEPVVRIMGRSVWHVLELRAMLGIVTNDLIQTCIQPYPVRETVLSGFHSSIGIWEYHQVTPEMERKADDAIEFMGLGALSNRLMTELSSGEARRAVIARALVHDPQALLLDEPTNSLDIQAFRELRDTMSKLARHGVTVVLVTHHLPDIVPEIDRIVCLKEGRLFRDGAKRDVLRAETLTELFDTDVRIFEHDGLYQMY